MKMITEKMKKELLANKDSGKLKVYVSGAVSALGYNEAKVEFERFSDELRKLGLIPFSTFTGNKPKNRVKSVYNRDGIIEMMKCDMVAMMPNWDVSSGAYNDMLVAKIMEIPVVFP